MEKFELEPALCEEIRAKVFGADFMKLVQTVRRGGATFRISLRPVAIGGERRFQAEMVEDGQVQVRNFGEAGAREGLEEIIAQKGARDLHLICGSGDLHVRVTRKGRAAVSRSAKLERKVELKPHDRVKNVPLNAFDAAALLRVLGIADGEGRIRASMRGKYDQVNEFLKAVGETVKVADKERPFVVVDCGCGKAYLTLALYFYLTQVVGLANVKVYGIDRRGDVIAAARRRAAQLDLEGKVEFIEADLEAAKLDRADLVVSLHACDTATDEALARAVEWGAAYVLSAPCCQHELQQHMAKSGNSTFAGLLRQSILRERFCDLLTDSFRAMIMRILGYRVQVVEFVSSEATMRNILIRCELGLKCGQPGPVSEYLNLRDYWRVEPWLAGRLQKILGKYLAPYCQIPENMV